MRKTLPVDHDTHMSATIRGAEEDQIPRARLLPDGGRRPLLIGGHAGNFHPGSAVGIGGQTAAIETLAGTITAIAIRGPDLSQGSADDLASGASEGVTSRGAAALQQKGKGCREKKRSKGRIRTNIHATYPKYLLTIWCRYI